MHLLSFKLPAPPNVLVIPFVLEISLVLETLVVVVAVLSECPGIGVQTTL